ncbi:hypothetical protein JXA02_10405, partial [candidate division KSB1 bacterium]|nr:hypothetical protein [candidate division KSB1 bacterium]
MRISQFDKNSACETEKQAITGKRSVSGKVDKRSTPGHENAKGHQEKLYCHCKRSVMGKADKTSTPSNENTNVKGIAKSL